MGAFADERRAIETRFSSNYTDTVIKWENLPFDQQTTAHVALKVLPAGASRPSIGTTKPYHRYTGIIQVDIFVPENTGTDDARGYADTIEAIFRDAQFSAGDSGTITCGTPFYTTLGPKNGWHMSAVTIPYHRDKSF